MNSQILGVLKLIIVFSLVSNLYSAPTLFDFKDPKGVNSMLFSLDSVLEPIMGTANGISGTISFDPEETKSSTGKIVVSAKTIQTTNARMTKVLHSEDWIDVEKYPTVEFNFKEILSSEKKGNTIYELNVRGDFTLKGVTKKMDIPIRLSYLPGKLSSRQDKVNGDLLVIRTSFSIQRKEFNIKPDMDGMTVSETIIINVGIVGSAPK